jgi:hypothetical protein
LADRVLLKIIYGLAPDAAASRAVPA